MFDEGPRPNMVIRARGAVLGQTKVTSRADDEDAEVTIDLQAINGWIFQRTSELEAGHHALNSSKFPSRLDRASVYHR